MLKRTTVLSVSMEPETEQYHFFVPSVPFLVKSPYVIFIISIPHSPVKVVKRLCTAFKNFHVKNACTMASGCIFKNGAPTQVLRKVHKITKFGLCYTTTENIKIRKM